MPDPTPTPTPTLDFGAPITTPTTPHEDFGSHLDNRSKAVVQSTPSPSLDFGSPVTPHDKFGEHLNNRAQEVVTPTPYQPELRPAITREPEPSPTIRGYRGAEISNVNNYHLYNDYHGGPVTDRPDLGRVIQESWEQISNKANPRKLWDKAWDTQNIPGQFFADTLSYETGDPRTATNLAAQVEQAVNSRTVDKLWGKGDTSTRPWAESANLPVRWTAQVYNATAELARGNYEIPEWMGHQGDGNPLMAPLRGALTAYKSVPFMSLHPMLALLPRIENYTHPMSALSTAPGALLGLGAAIAAQPLTWLGNLGHGPLGKQAQFTLNDWMGSRATPLPVEGMKTLVPDVVHDAKLNRESIEGIVGHKTMQNQLGTAQRENFSEMPKVSGDIAKAQAENNPANQAAGITRLQYLEAQTRHIDNLMRSAWEGINPTPAYQALLDAKRAGSVGKYRGVYDRKAGSFLEKTFPPEVHTPTSMPGALDAMATKQVALEKAILQDINMRLFYALPIPVPRPLPFIGQAIANRVFGSRQENNILSHPLSSADPTWASIPTPAISVPTGPPHTPYAPANIPGPFAPGEPLTLPTVGTPLNSARLDMSAEMVGQVPHTSNGQLEMGWKVQQSGYGGMHRGLLTDQNLVRWAKRYLEAFSPDKRPEALQNIIATYEHFVNITRAHPNLMMGSTHTQLIEGVNRLNAYRQSPEFAQTAWDPEVRSSQLKEAFNNMHTAHNEIVDILDQASKTQSSVTGMGTQPGLGPVGATALGTGGTPKEMAFSLMKQAMIGNFDMTGPVTRFVNAYNQVMNAPYPFRYGVERNQQQMDMGHTARQTALAFNQIQDVMNKHLANISAQGHAELNALVNTTPREWARLLKDARLPDDYDILQGQGPINQWAAEVENWWDWHAQQAGNGRHAYSDLQWQAVKATNPHAVADFALRMKDVLYTGLDDQMRSGTLDPTVGNGTKAWIQSLDRQDLYHVAAMLHKVGGIVERDGVEGKLKEAAVVNFKNYLETIKNQDYQMGKKYAYPMEGDWAHLQNVLPRKELINIYWNTIEPWFSKYSRFLGVNSSLYNSTQRWEGGYTSSTRKSVDNGENWYEREVPTIMQRHGIPVNRNTKYATDKAFVLIKAYEKGQQSANADIKNEADRAVTEGYALLNKVGISQAQAIPLLNDMFADLKTKHLDGLLARDRLEGHRMVDVRDYIPMNLMGSRIDRIAFYDWLNGPGKTSPTGSGPPMMTGQFSPENLRVFHNAAELQVKLKEFKTWAKKQPGYGGAFGKIIHLEPDHSLASLLTTRYNSSYNATNNLRFINELEAMLPHGVAPMHRGPGGPGFVDLGELIPSMRGRQVERGLYDYLHSFVRQGENLNSVEGASNFIGHGIRHIRKLYKDINVTLSWTHAKNVVESALLRGINVVNPTGTMAAALNEMIHGPEPLGEKMLHPAVLAGKAISKVNPFHDQAMDHNMFGFSGHVFAQPLSEIIRSRLGIGKGIVSNKFQPILSKLEQGPWSAVIFDLLDRSLRLGGYEQGINMGLTPDRAVDWTNRGMIDYSMKWADPKMRALLQKMYMFPAWHFGNIRFHSVNMMENPLPYIALQQATQMWNDHQQHGYHHESMPNLLARSIQTGRTMPGTTNDEWIVEGNPHDSYGDFVKTMTNDLETPMRIPVDAAKFIVNPMGPFTGKTVFDWAHENVQQLPKSGKELLMGTPEKGGGVIPGFFWGGNQFGVPDIIRSIAYPEMRNQYPNPIQASHIPIFYSHLWPEKMQALDSGWGPFLVRMFAHTIDQRSGGKIDY